MNFKHDYSTQSQEAKLRILAAYHAEMAVDVNKAKPGWTHEAAFHWEVAHDLIAQANLLEKMK